MSYWEPNGSTYQNLCTAKAFIACTSRTTSTTCGYGNGCSWQSSSVCTGTSLACSSRNQTQCQQTSSGCTWNTSYACTGTRTACSTYTTSGSSVCTSVGCSWCPGNAPEIKIVDGGEVCIFTWTIDPTTAEDSAGNDITSSIVTNSPVGITKDTHLRYYFNKNALGTVTMEYNVTDSNDLAAEQRTRDLIVGYCATWAAGDWGVCVDGVSTREVVCKKNGVVVGDAHCDANTKPDTTGPCNANPVITPQSTKNIYVYTTHNDTTTANDYEDGNITSDITTNLPAGMEKENDLRYYFVQPGSYTINYNVQDSAGNSAEQKSSTVNVSYDPQYGWAGEWGECSGEPATRTRVLTCEKTATGEIVSDAFCPLPRPAVSEDCRDAAFQCSADNIHWGDCNQTFFLASPRSRIHVRDNTIGTTSWRWEVAGTNDEPEMRIPDDESAKTQRTSFRFNFGDNVAPRVGEFTRKIRLHIGLGEEAGIEEKDITVKLVNPEIKES